MKILGISEGHNCTAAIMSEGKILAAASEERFSRLKNANGYPKKAIDFCLRYTNINPQELDFVAISSTDLQLWWNGLRNEALFSVQDHVNEQHEYFKKVLIDGQSNEEVAPRYIEKLLEKKGYPQVNYDFSGITVKDLLGKELNLKIRKNTIIKHLGISEEKIKFIDHHDCHAAYAYFSSPYRDDNTLIMTMDSSGDRGINATLSVASKEGINKIFETTNCQLGRIYKYVTLLLGMKLHEHEYKVMGLAPYTNAKELNKSYPVFNEVLKVNDLEFEWVKKPKDLYFHFVEKLEGHRFDGIAGALQQKLEELVSQWLKNALKKTNSKIVLFGGGLAMNIKLNLTLTKILEVEKFFVPASPADESNAIGACFYQYYQHCQKEGVAFQDVFPLEDGSVYLGPDFDYQGMLTLVENDKMGKYEIFKNIDDAKVAQMIAEGKIVSRCIGRMEFGARALGNRTILADGSKLNSVRQINRQIKHRDFWMPFAPSIMEDQAGRYLVNDKNLSSDYMTLGFETKKLAHQHILAALHQEDLTARPQIVRQSQNPGYYNLLKEFFKLTGHGGLLNTSLNLHGHPIVCFPEDLLMVLENSDLEYVYIKDHLIHKKMND